MVNLVFEPAHEVPQYNHFYNTQDSIVSHTFSAYECREKILKREGRETAKLLSDTVLCGTQVSPRFAPFPRNQCPGLFQAFSRPRDVFSRTHNVQISIFQMSDLPICCFLITFKKIKSLEFTDFQDFLLLLSFKHFTGIQHMATNATELNSSLICTR